MVTCSRARPGTGTTCPEGSPTRRSTYCTLLGGTRPSNLNTTRLLLVRSPWLRRRAHWDRTRIGAGHKAHEFRRQDAALRESGLRCTLLAGLDAASSHAGHELLRCRSAADALTDTLAAARTAEGTWVKHIRDMNALRAGEITPEMATAMWIQHWHVGARELEAYDRTVAGASSVKCR